MAQLVINGSDVVIFPSFQEGAKPVLESINCFMLSRLSAISSAHGLQRALRGGVFRSNNVHSTS